MPTGYTAEVGDGKVTDLRTFALRCARQFGATIMQRDEPMDEPPKHREPSDYHEKRLAETRALLGGLNAMTVADAERAATAEHEERLALDAKYEAERKATYARYEAMLKQVVAWEPPTAGHVGLREFMESQLRESIKFDCSPSLSRAPKPLTGAEWLQAKKEKALRDLEWNAAEAEKELARCASANAWIDALYASLEPLAAATPASRS